MKAFCIDFLKLIKKHLSLLVEIINLSCFFKCFYSLPNGGWNSSVVHLVILWSICLEIVSSSFAVSWANEIPLFCGLLRDLFIYLDIFETRSIHLETIVAFKEVDNIGYSGEIAWWAAVSITSPLSVIYIIRNASLHFMSPSIFGFNALIPRSHSAANKISWTVWLYLTLMSYFEFGSNGADDGNY